MADVHDVVDLLMEDHRRLGSLVERPDDEQDPSELREIYLRLVGELAAHEACEQRVVFPVLRELIPARCSGTTACVGEHDEINSLLDEMRVLDPSCYGFMKRASALALDLQAHFAEEEELFADLRAVLDPADLAALAARARTAKSYAPAFPTTSRHRTETSSTTRTAVG